MKTLMILVIANQIELHSENLQGNACIVGTTIHLYHIESYIMETTENQLRPLVLKYNLGETNLADYPVRSILSDK